MGSIEQNGSTKDDDNNALFPFAASLYDEREFDPLELDLSDAEELVPLVELVSSDDALLAYALDADANTFGAHLSATQPSHIVQPQLQEVAVAEASATSASHSLRRQQQRTQSTPTRTATKKPRNSTATAKKLPKQNPNKARDERKGELIYLRQKVAALETQLDAIQAKRPRITTIDSSTVDRNPACADCLDALETTHSCPHGVAVVSQPQLPIVVNVWQDIASRQSEERVKAERENIRLRLVLENQLKVAKSLEKVLHKKTTTKDIEEFVARNNHPLCTPNAANASDEAVFNALLLGVQKSYANIDAVFEANGLAHTETPLSHARMRSDSANTSNSMLLELYANKILPFDMVATSDAVWHHFAFAKEHTPFRYYSYSSSKFIQSSEDTVVENFILKLDAKNTVGNFRVKQILRRHNEVDRVVIVWRASIEAFEFSDEPVAGIKFCESGFIVIKKPQTLAGDHTLLQTCYIFTPNFTDVSGGSGFDSQRVGAITDFVLASTASNITSTHQMIENVLLEQALKKRSDRGQSVVL